MSGDGLWSRIKKGRLVQVLGVYLAASWVVLQVVGELRDSLELPAWIGPVAFILLGIGLLMVLATAWVQSHPLVDAKEATDAVPRSWELDVAEIRSSLRRGEVPHLTWARAALGGLFAFALLFGFAGLYVIIQDRGESFEPAAAMAENAAPGIAILPFAVRGEGLELWEEGMVHTLATNLDGAGGFRTIASQTVLARWHAVVPGGQRPDLPTAIAVARAAGARYAVTGNALSAGAELRLTADVYDVDTQEPLDHAQVEGPADSMFALVDRLSIEVLRSLLSDEDLAESALSLADVTSGSLTALRAYLEGEALFRRGQIEAAIPLYEQAVEADSTFAMASYRLDQAYSWTPFLPRSQFGEGAIERAVRHADGLPRRQAELVRARYAQSIGSLDGIPVLRSLTLRHPEDAEVWYLLGDAYFHLGGRLLVDLSDVREAFQRAVENVPGFAPYWIHVVDLAAIGEPDSAAMGERLSVLRELAAGTETVRERDLSFRMMFGDSSTQRTALDETEVTGPLIGSLASTGVGLEPRFAPQREALARKVFDVVASQFPTGAYNFFMPALGLARGKVGEAIGIVDTLDVPPEPVACQLFRAHTVGLPVPPERLDETFAALDTTAVDSCSAVARGALAADRGEWDVHEVQVDRLRGQIDVVRQDTTLAEARRERLIRFWEAQARELEGYGYWRRGERAEAVAALEEARPDSDWFARWWLAQIQIELERPEEAARYLESLRYRVGGIIDYWLGRVSEQLGRTDDARRSYEAFVIAYEEADPELQPRVEEARQALARLMDASPAPR